MQDYFADTEDTNIMLLSLQKTTSGKPNEPIEVNAKGSTIVIVFIPEDSNTTVKADTISVISCSEPSEYSKDL